MNLHQKLKSIESQRDRIVGHAPSNGTATCEKPTEGLTIKIERLENGTINKQRIHDSIIQHSLTS